MATTANPGALKTFMVVATIRDSTNLAELVALRADEEKQLEVLHSDGRTIQLPRASIAQMFEREFQAFVA